MESLNIFQTLHILRFLVEEKWCWPLKILFQHIHLKNPQDTYTCAYMIWYFTDYKILLFVTFLCAPLRKEKILQLNYDNNLLQRIFIVCL